jgi:predicted Zn-dependent protease
LLCEAEQRHKRSVAVLEHLAMITAQTGRDAELDRVLRTLEGVDPTSRVLRIFDETTQEHGREWAENVDATQARLLEAAGSSDEQEAEAAVRELSRWARSFPANSTYAVNHAFGLIMRGRFDEARQVARDARRIEDGSFTDAVNLGQILCSTDASQEGLELLREAERRARSDEEREIVAEALAQAGER